MLVWLVCGHVYIEENYGLLHATWVRRGWVYWPVCFVSRGRFGVGHEAKGLRAYGGVSP